jgi:uncharacterized protein (DUF2342 family)
MASSENSNSPSDNSEREQEELRFMLEKLGEELNVEPLNPTPKRGKSGRKSASNLAQFNAVINTISALMNDSSSRRVKEEIFFHAKNHLSGYRVKTKHSVDLTALGQEVTKLLKKKSKIISSNVRFEPLNQRTWLDETMPNWMRYTKALDKATQKRFAGLDEDDDGRRTFLGIRVYQYSSLISQSLDPEGASAGTSIARAFFVLETAHRLGGAARCWLTTSDHGFPLIDDCVGVVMDNMHAFAKSIGEDFYSVLRFAVARDLAILSLYAKYPWVGSQILALVRKYVNLMNAALESLSEEVINLENSEDSEFESPTAIIDSASLIHLSSMRPPIRKVFNRLTYMIDMVEAWASVLTYEALKEEDPASVFVMDEFRVKRMRFGSTEIALSIILGIDVDRSPSSDAYSFWKNAFAKHSKRDRDRIWEFSHSHPNGSLLRPNAKNFKFRVDWDREFKKMSNHLPGEPTE